MERKKLEAEGRCCFATSPSDFFPELRKKISKNICSTKWGKSRVRLLSKTAHDRSIFQTSLSSHMLDTEIRSLLFAHTLSNLNGGGARIYTSYLYEEGDDERGQEGRGECVRTHRSGKLRSPLSPSFPRDQGKYKFIRPFQTRSTTANTTVHRVNFVPLRITGIPARTNKR